MATKKTLTLTQMQCTTIITAIRSGFCVDRKQYQPNNRIATALTLEAISESVSAISCTCITATLSGTATA